MAMRMSQRPTLENSTSDDGPARRLTRTRLVGHIGPPALNVVTAPTGQAVGLPGQGGVITNVTLVDRAGDWLSDHLEPGISVVHPDADADRALQVLACVGNVATVLDGPARGARGFVFGKHGAVLVMLDRTALAKVAPGERVAIDAEGVGAELGDREVAIHSCDPRLLAGLVEGRTDDGRWRVPVVTVLPPSSAGAGQGMSAARFDLDILVDGLPPDDPARHLRFGDIIAIADQDHRTVRAPRSGYLAVGNVCHGRSVGGGHGLGLVTLLSGPVDRFDLVPSTTARLDHIITPPWETPT
jgi:hypothetical protein